MPSDHSEPCYISEEKIIKEAVEKYMYNRD